MEGGGAVVFLILQGSDLHPRVLAVTAIQHLGRERQRQTERETDRNREKVRERDLVTTMSLVEIPPTCRKKHKIVRVVAG